MAKTKGLSFNYAIEFVRENYGEEGFKRVLDALSDGDRMVLSEKILHVSWRPTKTFSNFLSAIDKVLGKGKRDLSREAGRFVAEHSLSKFYKVIIRLASPMKVLDRASELWKDFDDTGELQIEKTGPNSAIARVIDHQDGSGSGCNHTTGFFEKTLEMTGAKNVAIAHTKCIFRGDEHCEYIGTWE